MEYKLKNLTGADAQTLWAALGELPAKVSFSLMCKVQQQFEEQEAAQAAQQAGSPPGEQQLGESHGKG